MIRNKKETTEANNERRLTIQPPAGEKKGRRAKCYYVNVIFLIARFLSEDAGMQLL